MGIINEKVLAVTIIAILYALTLLLKPQTILRIVIKTLLGIISVIWALDFFGLYPVTKLIPIDFYS